MKILVSELRPHPLNATIYGDTADKILVESIQENGILEPLLIDQQQRIISGHRRFDAAFKAKLTEVPVEIFQSTDELTIQTAIVEANRQRVKTNEQLAREATLVFRIEQEKAENRRATANQKRQPPAKSLEDSGDAREVAAKKLGIGAKKVEQSSAVIEAIDRLRASGDVKNADIIRSELQRSSVNRAYKIVKEGGFLGGVPANKPSEEEDYILLEDWKIMSAEQRKEALEHDCTSPFIPQTSDGIEFAKWTWDPITGCKHNCDYCNASDMANSLFPQKFAPSFYPGRLKCAEKTKVPVQSKTDITYKNVLTCWIGDLFGGWVPDELIQLILDAVQNARSWNFLFLTKFPERLLKFNFPRNSWVGATVDRQSRVSTAEKVFKKINTEVTWLSCEPMFEDLTFQRLDLFQWVVIGGSNKSTNTQEFKPPRAWVQHMWDQAKKAKSKIYEKPNLLERSREYPTDDDI
jgi:protein gp37/ParB-like chromosome segregation protein Spo0J